MGSRIRPATSIPATPVESPPQQGPRILIFLAGYRCRGLVRNSPQGAKEVRGGVSEVCDRGRSGAILIIRTVNATRNGEYERDELRASNREGRPANLQGCGCGPGRDRPPRSSQNVVESADRIGDHPAGFGRPPASSGGTSSDDSLQSGAARFGLIDRICFEVNWLRCRRTGARSGRTACRDSTKNRLSIDPLHRT
jgi:hypothetical protein